MAVPESGNIAVLAEKPSVARDIARLLALIDSGLTDHFENSFHLGEEAV